MTNIPCEQKIIYKCTIILDFYYVTITIAKFHTKKSKITIKYINYSKYNAQKSSYFVLNSEISCMLHVLPILSLGFISKLFFGQMRRHLHNADVCLRCNFECCMCTLNWYHDQ